MDDAFLVLVKAGLFHAQFETLHPFADGNGRTGRMLITMFLWQKKMLSMPILYLSSFFRKHQQLYYDKLQGYHNGQVYEWLDFFFDGIISTADSAIKTCISIADLRERDMQKIHSLGKTSARSTMDILIRLFKMPIVGIADMVQWTGFTNRGGYNVINRLVDMQILKPMKKGDSIYAQKWIYDDYVALFNDD